MNRRSNRTRAAATAAAAVVTALVVTVSGGAVPAQGSAADGGELRMMWSVSPPTLDPVKSSASYFHFLMPVYDSLFSLSVEGEPTPMLATSFEFDTDESGGNLLRLELIEGWSFHDGTSFDADAVAANIDRAINAEGSTVAGDLSAIVGVRVVGDHTVELDLSRIAPELPFVFTQNAGMMVSPAAFDAADLDLMAPGGSGAYRVVEHLPGDRIVYEPVDEYWDDIVRVDRLEISMSTDDDARLNALLAGTADITFVRPSQVGAVLDAGFSLTDDLDDPDFGVGARAYPIFLNNDFEPFRDVRVRQALDHAVDRELIAHGLLDGWCPATSTFIPHFSSSWAISPETPAAIHPHDVERAKELLAEAGYGEGFEFTAAVNQISVFTQIAEVLQQQFADVGVTMNIETMAFAQANEAYYVNKSHEALVTIGWGAADPSSVAESLFRSDSLWNPGGYENPQMAELLANGVNTADTDERASFYQQAFEIGAEEVYPAISICGIVSTAAIADGVEGFETYPDGVRRIRGVYKSG